jgi:hypothetical protein
LIELLSRPLSHWVSKVDTSRFVESDIGSALEYGRVVDDQPKKEASSSSILLPSFFPVSSPAPGGARPKTTSTSKNKNNALRIDRQELNNVKLLCAQVLKGHKKLSKQLKVCQEQLSKKDDDDDDDDDKSKRDTATTKQELLQELNEQQQFHFRRQLIALDMKERAFTARVCKMEERCEQHCADQLFSWKQSMHGWKSQTEDQWKEWKVLLDHEVQVNARFRNDFSLWMEDHQSNGTIGPLGCEQAAASFESGKENDDDDDKTTPILFATNLGEVSESAPLCNSGSSSSDDAADADDDAAILKHAVNDGDEDDDELRKVPLAPPRRPFLIRRRHPWTPLARKWDRVCL